MRKLGYAVFVLAVSPLLFASDADKAVMMMVFTAASRASYVHGVAPAVVREKTQGGADSLATQWMEKMRGEAIGRELAESYESVNARQEDVNDFLPNLVKTVDLDAPYDWKQINDDFPAAKAVLVFSRPAFDSLGSYAFVRSDLFPKDGTATTTFWDLERLTDGAWKVVHMAVIAYQASRLTNAHLSGR